MVTSWVSAVDHLAKKVSKKSEKLGIVKGEKKDIECVKPLS